jgi:hypothetical protein
MKPMKEIVFAVTVTGAIILAASCRKIEELPDTPRIEFQSFEIFDTTDILGNKSKGGRLKFYFEDGDGNVGLKQPETRFDDSTNLFFTLYKKTNGIMQPASKNDPLAPAAYRVPYMVRLGQNKILKGTISVTFLYLFYTPADTISYDFYLEDRDYNESNVETTSEIILSVNKIYKKE